MLSGVTPHLTQTKKYMNPIVATINETMWKDNPSARQIIASKLRKMSKYPSEYLAQELEEMGIVCDYQASDAGNDPQEKIYE